MCDGRAWSGPQKDPLSDTGISQGRFRVFALFFGKDLAQMYITTCGADCSKETPRKAEKGVRPQPLAMMFLYFCRKHCKDGRHKKESSSYSTVNITVLRHLPKKIVLPAFQKLRCSRLAFQPESSCIYPDVSQHKPSIVQRIIQTFLRYA